MDAPGPSPEPQPAATPPVEPVPEALVCSIEPVANGSQPTDRRLLRWIHGVKSWRTAVIPQLAKCGGWIARVGQWLINPEPPTAPSPNSATRANLSRTPQQPSNPSTPFGWTLQDRRLLMAGVIVASGLLVGHWWRLSWLGQPRVEVSQLPAADARIKVAINSAPWVEFLLLEGVGEKLARRIVADRDSRGPFSSIDDLQRVNGVGAKLMERWRSQLTMGPGPAVAADAQSFARRPVAPRERVRRGPPTVPRRRGATRPPEQVDDSQVSPPPLTTEPPLIDPAPADEPDND